MRYKSFQILESIGTILWLVMDYSWMSGFRIASEVSGVIASILLFCAFWTFMGRKTSEKITYAASFLWCLMNLLWMESEYTHLAHLLTISKGIFIIASILVIFVIILSILQKSVPDIKRLKIK